jgi:hypothetical protein
MYLLQHVPLADVLCSPLPTAAGLLDRANEMRPGLAGMCLQKGHVHSFKVFLKTHLINQRVLVTGALTYNNDLRVTELRGLSLVEVRVTRLD